MSAIARNSLFSPHARSTSRCAGVPCLGEGAHIEIIRAILCWFCGTGWGFCAAVSLGHGIIFLSRVGVLVAAECQQEPRFVPLQLWDPEGQECRGGQIADEQGGQGCGAASETAMLASE